MKPYLPCHRLSSWEAVAETKMSIRHLLGNTVSMEALADPVEASRDRVTPPCCPELGEKSLCLWNWALGCGLPWARGRAAGAAAFFGWGGPPRWGGVDTAVELLPFETLQTGSQRGLEKAHLFWTSVRRLWWRGCRCSRGSDSGSNFTLKELSELFYGIETTKDNVRKLIQAHKGVWQLTEAERRCLLHIVRCDEC